MTQVMEISPIVLRLPWKLPQNEVFGSCCYFDDPDIKIPTADVSGAILCQGQSNFNEGLEIVDGLHFVVFLQNLSFCISVRLFLDH